MASMAAGTPSIALNALGQTLTEEEEETIAISPSASLKNNAADADNADNLTSAPRSLAHILKSYMGTSLLGIPYGMYGFQPNCGHIVGWLVGWLVASVVGFGQHPIMVWFYVCVWLCVCVSYMLSS
jgi:hypothetical protein